MIFECFNEWYGIFQNQLNHEGEGISGQTIGSLERFHIPLSAGFFHNEYRNKPWQICSPVMIRVNIINDHLR